jgi:hypothetical protein
MAIIHKGIGLKIQFKAAVVEIGGSTEQTSPSTVMV